jgi:autotransporter family porin
MHTTIWRAAGAAVVLGLLGLVPSCAIVPRSGPPPPGGYGQFELLPVGADLPTGAACARQVTERFDGGWEPRAAENGTANRTVPDPKPDLGTLPDFDDVANTGERWAPRVDGDFTGTTEQILLWAACKWGLDDQWLRAQLVVESFWDQRTAGDVTYQWGHCPGDAFVDRLGRCAESYGLLQNKYRFNRSAYPAFRTSTAYGLDFSGFKLRACYEGHKYTSEGAVGDWPGCVGNWFSGAWHDPLAERYVGWVRVALRQQVWTDWPDTDG